MIHKLDPETGKIIWYIFATVMVYVCVYCFRTYRRLSYDGQKIQGEITDIWKELTRPNSKRIGNVKYKAKYSYVVAGKSYTGWYPDATESMKKGDKIAVVYDPQKPSRCVVEGKAEQYSRVSLFMALALIGISVLVYMSK